MTAFRQVDSVGVCDDLFRHVQPVQTQIYNLRPWRKAIFRGFEGPKKMRGAKNVSVQRQAVVFK